MLWPRSQSKVRNVQKHKQRKMPQAAPSKFFIVLANKFCSFCNGTRSRPHLVVKFLHVLTVDCSWRHGVRVWMTHQELETRNCTLLWPACFRQSPRLRSWPPPRESMWLWSPLAHCLRASALNKFRVWINIRWPFVKENLNRKGGMLNFLLVNLILARGCLLHKGLSLFLLAREKLFVRSTILFIN